MAKVTLTHPVLRELRPSLAKMAFPLQSSPKSDRLLE